MPARVSVSLGLIVTELVINALKHAFPEPRRGAIRVGLHLIGEDIVLSVEDNGVGLPAERRVGAMGMRLIEGMARGLSGTLNIDGDQKTLIRVQFPLSSASGL